MVKSGAKGRAPTRVAQNTLQDRKPFDRDHPNHGLRESNPSRLDRGGSSCRRDRESGFNGFAQAGGHAVILFDGTLRVNASQRIDGFIAERATLALGVCDRRVIVPGVHWGPGSTSSAKMHPCSTLHKSSRPGMEDGSRSPVLGSL